MNIENRLQSLDARLSARAAELEKRIDARLAPSGAAPKAAGQPPVAQRALAPFALAGTRYGLFVGVNEYAVYPDGHRPGVLCGCIADARNVAAACRELGGWSLSHIRTLENRSATLESIRRAIADLASSARPGDVILYFHSSHGGRDPEAAPDNDTYLCTYDRPYFEADLWSDIAAFKEGVKLVCIIDACHSGGLIGKDASAPVPPTSCDFMRRIGDCFKSASRPAGGIRIEDIGWITAAAGTQYSLDAGKIGGLFATRTLVNEGWRAGAADGYTDAILSMGGEAAVQSAQAATALPAMAVPQPVGSATFLDLALYACRTWKDRFSTSEEGLLQHIPQFFNPGLLNSVVAGRAGVASVL